MAKAFGRALIAARGFSHVMPLAQLRALLDKDRSSKTRSLPSSSLHTQNGPSQLRSVRHARKSISISETSQIFRAMRGQAGSAHHLSLVSYPAYHKRPARLV